MLVDFSVKTSKMKWYEPVLVEIKSIPLSTSKNWLICYNRELHTVALLHLVQAKMHIFAFPDRVALVSACHFSSKHILVAWDAHHLALYYLHATATNLQMIPIFQTNNGSFSKWNGDAGFWVQQNNSHLHYYGITKQWTRSHVQLQHVVMHKSHAVGYKQNAMVQLNVVHHPVIPTVVAIVEHVNQPYIIKDHVYIYELLQGISKLLIKAPAKSQAFKTRNSIYCDSAQHGGIEYDATKNCFVTKNFNKSKSSIIRMLNKNTIEEVDAQTLEQVHCQQLHGIAMIANCTTVNDQYALLSVGQNWYIYNRTEHHICDSLKIADFASTYASHFTVLDATQLFHVSLFAPKKQFYFFQQGAPFGDVLLHW